MRQPKGFINGGSLDHVCHLKKSLYGLKQSARSWNNTFTQALVEIGFKPSPADPCLFTRGSNETLIILLVYVDDLLVASISTDLIGEVRSLIAARFSIKDLGELRFFLGFQIERNRHTRELWISQRKYIQDVLARFNMTDCKAASTPMATSAKLS